MQGAGIQHAQSRGLRLKSCTRIRAWTRSLIRSGRELDLIVRAGSGRGLVEGE